MKKKILVLSIYLIAVGMVYGGELCRSGDFILSTETGKIANIRSEAPRPTALRDTLDLIANGGFESGSLPPWETYMWQVTNIDSHTGRYCAADVGNYWIRQNITPVLTDSIVSITFWSRQPEAQIQAFDFIYDDSTYYEWIVYVGTAWQMFDITSYLPVGRTMVALRLWGYSGGPPGIDSTYMDDVSVLARIPGQGVEERTATARPLAFNISPNPVRGNAVIECAALSGDNPVLSVYDAKGTMAKRAIMESCEYIWSTRGLETGVYFVRLDNGSGLSAVRKITVISD